MNDRWLTPKRLEEMFFIKISTQHVLRSKKKIPYTKFGGFIYYDIGKINELLEDHAIEMR